VMIRRPSRAFEHILHDFSGDGSPGELFGEDGTALLDESESLGWRWKGGEIGLVRWMDMCVVFGYGISVGDGGLD